MSFTIRGPKGNVVVRAAELARLTKILPGLVKRFGRVSIVEAPPSSEELRARIVEFCRWSIAHQGDWHYAQERPMERLLAPGQLKALPRRADCSEHATDAYAYAGAPDPNGQNYNGTGFTGTMLSHCRNVPRLQAKPGDLAVFGSAPGRHVVVLLEAGNKLDPLVCSHGQEAGPIALHLSSEAAVQPSPITYLSCLD